MRLVVSSAFALACLALSNSALALDHLEPETSILGGNQDAEDTDYAAIIATVFKDAYQRNVVARVVVEPSFLVEYAVGVRSDKGTYTIFTLKPEVQLWSYESLKMMESGEEQILKEDGTPVRDDKGIADLRKQLPADWHDVKVERCEAPIDQQIGEQITEVWRLVVRGTRYENSDIESIGVDGTTYHFAQPGVYGYAGQTWSPNPSSTPGKLVAISDAMATFCQYKSPHALTALTEVVDSLLGELKQKSP